MFIILYERIRSEGLPKIFLVHAIHHSKIIKNIINNQRNTGKKMQMI